MSSGIQIPIEEVEALLSSWDGTSSPGCAIALLQRGNILYSKGYGMADLEQGSAITPRTRFYVGSVAKQFTAMCVALAAHRGLLDLDDDIRKWVPEVPKFGAPITLRHLVHHTSGLREKFDLLDMAGRRVVDLINEAYVIDLVKRQRALNFETGTDHSYCNTGYTLLTMAVGRAMNSTFRDAARELIFDPLGMRDSEYNDDYRRLIARRARGYEPSDEGYRLWEARVETVGDGGLYTTVEDMALWDGAFYGGVFPDEVLELVQTPGRLSDGRALTYAFGLGISEYRGERRVQHDGGLLGYRAVLMRLPRLEFAVAILANSASFRPQTVAERIADLCVGERLGAAQQASRIEPAPEAWAGVYRLPGTPRHYRVEADQGKLYLRFGEVRLELEGAGGQRVRYPGLPELELGSDGSGAKTLTARTAHPESIVIFSEITGTASSVQRFAGTYQSDELDVAWTLEPQEDGLVLRRRWFADVPVIAVDEDLCSAGYSLLFPGDGRMLVGNARSRNVEFRKVS
ncbi:MAG: serine hydrolase domain-containing protein [Pseudomonadales bacterium]